jgi:hypothetical protein
MGGIVVEIEQVKYYLDIWTDYMKHGGRVVTGYPSKSAGFYTGGSHSTEDLTDEMDIKHQLATNAAVNDLPKDLKDSVYATHGLGNRSNMTLMSIAYNYQLALAELATRLEKKHLF